MRFTLVDQILDCQPGQSLRAAKNLALGEEYLADHFPRFPVMPGVLMLQCLVESSAWLWRLTSDYRHSVIVLRDVKNVKYGHFMEPGRRMEMTVELAKQDGESASFKGKAVTDAGNQTVSAAFTLVGYNLADRTPHGKPIDEQLLAHWRARHVLLTGGLRPG
jgi:3-hydroxyacyl-[acyl-carrier-protein] dehydratase